MDLSNGTPNNADQRRGQSNDPRRAYAWSAEAFNNGSRRPAPPIKNDSNFIRRPQNWNGKERAAIMRPPNKMPMAPRNAKLNNFRQQNAMNANIICYTCGERGHMSPNCPKRIEKGGFKGFKDGNRGNPRVNLGAHLVRLNPERPGQRNDWKKPLQIRRNDTIPRRECNNKPRANAAMGAKAKFETIPSQEEYLCLTTVEFESLAISDGDSTMIHNNTTNSNADTIGTFEMDTASITSFDISTSMFDDEDHVPTTIYIPDEEIDSDTSSTDMNSLTKRLEKVNISTITRDMFENIPDCANCRNEHLYCRECLNKYSDPYIMSLKTMEEVAASTQLSDFEMDDVSKNSDFQEALRSLYQIDEMTQPNFDPAEALARLDEQPRVMSRLDEDYVIHLYESGTFPDDLRLREDYFAIMERRANETTESSTNSTITAGTSTEEDIITYDEEIDREDEESNAIIRLERAPTPANANNDNKSPTDEGDIIYDEFANQTHDESDDKDDLMKQCCDLIYEINLQNSFHSIGEYQPTTHAEHYEIEDSTEPNQSPPWPDETDDERINQLEELLTRTDLKENEQNDSKECFTQNEVECLDEDTVSDDAATESANSTNVENAEAATVNKIYGGPADSLAHGWLIDSGASCHMTPFKSDLSNIQQCRANVTVADGTKIRADTLGDVTLLLPTNEDHFNPARILLRRVLYVPGLNRRLFSVPTFTKMPGYEMTFYENRVHITLPDGKTADVPNNNEGPGTSKFASPAFSYPTTHLPTQHWPQQQMNRNEMKLWNPKTMKDTESKRGMPFAEQAQNTETDDTDVNQTASTIQTHNKFLPKSAAVDLDLLHDRLGHRKTTAIITASHHRVWEDTYCVATKDHFCTSCPIATISRARTPRQYSRVPDKPLAKVYIDTVPNPSCPGITVDSSWTNLLIVVDHFSRFLWIDGMLGKGSEHVINSLKRYIARFGNIVEIRSDAGTEFISNDFEQWCTDNKIHFTATAPARQHQNGICECHWASTSNMARKMLIRAHLNKKFLYHAIKYAAVLHNVLPVKGITKPNGDIATPHELFYGKKPKIKNLRVFGCPAVRKCYSASDTDQNSQQLSQWNLQCGIRCIFIGLPDNRAGWLFYSPNTRLSTSVSYDAVFDESFSTPIALSIPPFTGGVPYRNININAQPTKSLYDGQMEMTGDITTIPPSSFQTDNPQPLLRENELENETTSHNDLIRC